MKLLTEYLEHALNFERLAVDESNPQLKEAFEQQRRPIGSLHPSGGKSSVCRHPASRLRRNGTRRRLLGIGD
jgi:hypothetical protein